MSKLALFGGSKAVGRPFPAWPVYDDEDERNLVEVLRSRKWWLYAFGQGALFAGDSAARLAQSEQFEREFARGQHVRHCLAVNSGTSALEIALDACEIGPGDEVITTPYTFIATSSAILTRCALPVYVDIHGETYNIDPARIEEAITPKTKAILVVHLGGEIADMEAILAIAGKHGLRVIEDAAQASGAVLEGNRGAGGMGDVGIFSFQASKVLTSGEGGACTTRDDGIAELLWSLRNCGRSPAGVWYEHHQVGHNLRMTEFQGVVLRGQLRRLAEQCETRYRNYLHFCRNIESIPGIEPCRLHPNALSHPILLAMFRFTGSGWYGVSRDKVVEALAAEGIPAVTGYGWPTYRNPVFETMQEKMGHRAFAYGVDRFPNWSEYSLRCPVAERACSREAIWLPHQVFLGDESQVRMLADAFHKVYAGRSELGA